MPTRPRTTRLLLAAVALAAITAATLHGSHARPAAAWCTVDPITVTVDEHSVSTPQIGPIPCP
jgi:hypothetical protein